MTRFSRTVSSLSRVSACGTEPIRARIRVPSIEGSMPNTSSVPEGTGETQPIMRMVDVLPAPLGPRKPNVSPAPTSKSIPSTAVRALKRLVRPRASIRTEPLVSLLMGAVEDISARSRRSRAGRRWMRLRVELRQNLFGVTRGLHLLPNMGDLAVRSDQEGIALDPLILAAHELLQAPAAVGFSD